MTIAMREHEEGSSVSQPTGRSNTCCTYESVPADEQRHIERLIDNIRLLLERRYVDKPTLRDAHPKMHGCVKAQLEVSTDIDEELRHGLFATPGTHKGWVRFSSEHQDPAPDHRKDTRGLALKLLDIPGEKLLAGEESSPCHDFVFLSTPRFVARDVAGFDELIHALVHKSLRSALKSAAAFLRHWLSTAQHSSPLETEYFSVVPALLGPRPVKYIVRPQRATKSPIPAKSQPHFLRDRLVEQLASDDYCFDLLVQRFVDQSATPIEDPTVLWRVAAVKVATLRIPKQRDFDNDVRRKLGEELAFNPFRCLPEHRPLGGINRARHQVYRAISKFRHARNGVTVGPVPCWPEDEQTRASEQAVECSNGRELLHARAEM
jgi:hypothetical protein